MVPHGPYEEYDEEELAGDWHYDEKKEIYWRFDQHGKMEEISKAEYNSRYRPAYVGTLARAHLNIINWGLGYPKWYVKIYTTILLVWEVICGLTAIVLLFSVPLGLIILIPVFMVPPLLPLYFFRKRSEEKALEAKKEWEAEERKKREAARARALAKRVAFLKAQRAKGLVQFIDRHSVKRWGTPKQVKEWKRIDLGLRNNFADYSPREFEGFVCELFKRMGYSVEVGKYTQDFGIDIVAKRDNEVVVVEVKKWQEGNNVGADDVRSVLGAMWKAKANKAIIVTTSDFTVLAEEQAKGAPVELWNSHIFGRLVERYFISEASEALTRTGPGPKVDGVGSSGG